MALPVLSHSATANFLPPPPTQLLMSTHQHQSDIPPSRTKEESKDSSQNQSDKDNESNSSSNDEESESETNDHDNNKQDNQSNKEEEDGNGDEGEYEGNEVGKMDTSGKGEMAAHGANKNASKGGAMSTANVARQDDQDRG